MKSLKIHTTLFFLLLGASSCDSFLEIEPETILSTAVAFDNIEGIEAGINGTYSTLHSDWVERQYIFADCFASNVREVNTLSNLNYQRALRHAEWTDFFNTGNYLWDLSFRGVDLVNQVIEALPAIESSNGQIAQKKDHLLGEALFLRGLIYFVLNRFYGQPQNGLSAPLLSKPFIPGDMPVRATIGEVEARVVADLLEAEILMSNLENNEGRANIWAVKALLARVYFEYKDYANAEAYADQVIRSGKFSLADGNVAAPFSTSISSENIFTFLGNPIDRAAERLFERYSLNSSNVQLSVSDAYWDLISRETNDLRVTVLHQDLGAGVASHKYDNRDMNIPYIRLPEMYLIRAESKVENGNLDGGLEDLNRLRQRAGLAATAYADRADLLNKIFVERSLELSMEGDNYHNLKRLERPIGGFTWEQARVRMVFFIPEREILLNSNLVQNETW